MRTIRHISAGSTFKVFAVIYGLLTAIFGCLFFVLPGLLSSSLLSTLVRDERSLAIFGGGTVAIVVIYVFAIAAVAILQGIVAAIAALIYNIVAAWVGGIQVDLGD